MECQLVDVIGICHRLLFNVFIFLKACQKNLSPCSTRFWFEAEMVDFQFYAIILAALFGLLGALLFFKRRTDDTSGSGPGGRAAAAGGARRRAAVPIRDEDGQV